MTPNSNFEHDTAITFLKGQCQETFHPRFIKRLLRVPIDKPRNIFDSFWIFIEFFDCFSASPVSRTSKVNGFIAVRCFFWIPNGRLWEPISTDSLLFTDCSFKGMAYWHRSSWCITSVNDIGRVGDLLWLVIWWCIMSLVSTTPLRNTSQVVVETVKCVQIPVILYRSYFILNLFYTEFVLYRTCFTPNLFYRTIFYRNYFIWHLFYKELI